MSAPTLPKSSSSHARRTRRLSRRGILLVGIVAVPLALSSTLNGYGALTEDSALRMAFATVAGQTIAILSALASLGVTIARRKGMSPSAFPAQVVLFTVIAALVTLYAVGIMANAGDVLLGRLDLVAETDPANR